MHDEAVQFLDVGAGAATRRIATLVEAATARGAGGLMWLQGLKSDMVSTKAAAVAAYARAHGLSSTRFDYSGHGRSSGRFEDATVGDWLDEAEAVFRRLTRGPQVLIGSSTGGHIALLLLRRLIAEAPAEAARVRALVLIAPAWDLTEMMWRDFTDAERREVLEQGFTMRSSPYGDPYPITRRFIDDGRRHLFQGAPFDPGRPVFIMQGALDPVVPPSHARALAALLGPAAVLHMVADGEHRLSRPEDLDLLFRLVGKAMGMPD